MCFLCADFGWRTFYFPTGLREREKDMKKNHLITIIACAIALVAIVVVLILVFGKHEHTWSEWQVSKAVTCDNDGLNIRVCDKCGESQSMITYAQGHSWGAWSPTKKATCTDNGLETRVCDKCGESQSKTTYAKGHSWSSWSVTEQYTCTTNGSKERVCSCGEKETQIIVGGHSWESATCVDPKTCKKCNLTEGEALGHVGMIGSECTRCKQIIYPKVNMPRTPMAVYHSSALGTIIIEITQLSYKFTSSNRISVSFSAEVVSVSDEPLAKLTISVLDSDGYKIGSGSWMDVYPSFGDKYKESVSVSLELDENCSEITIVIE